ncbi:hypothetical protein [Veillonella criceti]|uniref:Uncharacterized protein n=1 Tax=Veillonella criceti TaxID=103891 RepID=A0A380NL40_9FIRM|nr:hypothetical protein [Veillonella criceti]SUP42277.1 Uncharacterised protein [Veillonella criceti]
MDWLSIFDWLKDNWSWIFGGSVVGIVYKIIKAFFFKPQSSEINNAKVHATQNIKAGKGSKFLQINGDVNIGGNNDRGQKHTKD